jgi:hypothetical protein
MRAHPTSELFHFVLLSSVCHAFTALPKFPHKQGELTGLASFNFDLRLPLLHGQQYIHFHQHHNPHATSAKIKPTRHRFRLTPNPPKHSLQLL